MEKPVNFSGGTVFFSALFICWFLFGCLLCLQGFGFDTDAWLMAQTAGRLRAGEVYDPARSFGNPVWEFLLSILQPDFEFRISNGLNLGLATLFLWRLHKLIPETSFLSYLFASAGLCLLPVFSEAASSSMELMPAWYLFLESLIALRQKRLSLLVPLALLLTFSRPEFFFFLAAATSGSYRKFLPWLLPILTALFIWLFWSFGKNPAPFQSLSEMPHFYAGRIWFLIRQAGLLLPVYLLLFYFCTRQQNPLLKWPGRISLAFFLLLPFEWSYAFPAILSGVLAASSNAKMKHIISLASISLGSSLIIPFSGLPALYTQRNKMLHQFIQAEAFLPEHKTLLLDGATFLPTRFANWDRSHQNRIFHKKNSLFWVAERLRKDELDSLRKEGFRICRLRSGKSADWIQIIP